MASGKLSRCTGLLFYSHLLASVPMVASAQSTASGGHCALSLSRLPAYYYINPSILASTTYNTQEQEGFV